MKINIFLKKIKSSLRLQLFFLFSLFFFLSILVTIPSSTHALDEGWAADIGNNIASGKSLYKDISAPYGPVVFYIYAFIISIFGKQFFIFRIVGLLIVILQAYYTVKIVRLFSQDNFIILSSACISLFSLGLYQGCRITASTVAGLLTLMLVFYHIKYYQNKNKRFLIFVGSLFGLLLLTKHNVFAIDVVGHGFFVLINSIILFRKEKRIDYSFLLIIVSFLAILTPYFIYTYSYFDILINDTILSISKYKSSDIVIPFPTIFEIFKMNKSQLIYSLFLYSIFPLLVLGVTILINIYKRNRKIKPELFFLFFITVLHFFEIYPLSDYSHYSRATVMYPSLIGVLLFFSDGLKNKLTSFLLVCTVSLHLYMSPINFLRSAITIKNEPISNLPYHQFIRKIHNEELMIKILNEIEQNNSDKILIIGHANVYYYLSDKLTNSRFSIVTNHYLSDGDQKEVIDEIVKNSVKMIIESPTVRENRELEELSVLNAYIGKNFKLSKEINGYNFYK